MPPPAAAAAPPAAAAADPRVVRTLDSTLAHIKVSFLLLLRLFIYFLSSTMVVDFRPSCRP